MASKLEKAQARLERRRRAYEDGKSNKRKDFCSERESRWESGGYHRPGSMNAHKSAPKGRG